MTDTGAKIAATANVNRMRRKAHEQDVKREQEIKRTALLSAIESGDLTASEKVQAVKMLNDLKRW